jgi:hypothetical protein
MQNAPPLARRPGRPSTLAFGALAVAGLAGACGGAGVGAPGTPAAAPAATEAEWRALAWPRPAPVPAATRLSLGEIGVLAEPQWPEQAGVSPSLGLSELVTTGLLRRADVHFVERRRFAEAAAAERAGTARPPGAPLAGTSPGAELVAQVVWAPLGAGRTSLEVRLVAAATGAVAVSRRSLAPADADPGALARLTVATVLGALAEAGRLPTWADPVPGAAPVDYSPSRISASAVESFLLGLAAEERWRWEDARVAYAAAAREPAFFEAASALARTARLRTGGTLGES